MSSPSGTILFRRLSELALCRPTKLWLPSCTVHLMQWLAKGTTMIQSHRFVMVLCKCLLPWNCIVLEGADVPYLPFVVALKVLVKGSSTKVSNDPFSLILKSDTLVFSQIILFKQVPTTQKELKSLKKSNLLIGYCWTISFVKWLPDFRPNNLFTWFITFHFSRVQKLPFVHTCKYVHMCT